MTGQEKRSSTRGRTGPGTSAVSRRTVLGAIGAVATIGLPSIQATAATPRDWRSGNIRVSRDAYDSHAEPALAANPRDPDNLVGACMSWHTGSPEIITTYASFDRGRTWHSNGALPLPPDNTMFADDVSVAFDPDGRGFVCAMAAVGPTNTDRGVYVWCTDDGGRSFSDPVAAAPRQFVDHPSLAVAADRSHLHTIWVASAHRALGYTRSLDGGTTFDAPRFFPAADRTNLNGPMVAAGRDGLVAAVYAVGNPLQADPDAQAGMGDPAGSGDDTQQVEVICSSDGGESFAAPVTLGTTAFVIALDGDVNPNSSPTIAAAPNRRALYAAFTTHVPGSGHSDIAVSASFDAGATWSTPAAATPADDRIYFQPQLAVLPHGRIALSAFALADGRVDTVLFTSPAARLEFTPPRTITTRPFDPALGAAGGKHGAWWIGDYQGLAADRTGAVHALWNDTRTGALELFTATVS